MNQPTADQGWWVGEVEREWRGESANVTNGGSGGLEPNPPWRLVIYRRPPSGRARGCALGALFSARAPQGRQG